MLWVHGEFPCVACVCLIWMGPSVNRPFPTPDRGVFACSMRGVLWSIVLCWTCWPWVTAHTTDTDLATPPLCKQGFIQPGHYVLSPPWQL